MLPRNTNLKKNFIRIAEAFCHEETEGKAKVVFDYLAI